MAFPLQHQLYHVPPASLYEQFLKNFFKTCSDLDKGPALSWQLYLSLLFLIQRLSNFSRVQLWTPLRKTIFNIGDEECHIHLWNYGWLKSSGVMQEVSHSHNVWQNSIEITQFTPEIWFYDAFWPTKIFYWKLNFPERLAFTFSEYYESRFLFQLPLKEQGFM